MAIKKEIVLVVQGASRIKTREGNVIDWHIHVVQTPLGDSSVYEKGGSFTKADTRIIIYIKGSLPFKPGMESLRLIAEDYFERSRDWYAYEFTRHA